MRPPVSVGFGGELVRQRYGLLEKIGVRHDTVNQAQAGGLFEVNTASGQDQLNRRLPSDIARQALRAAKGWNYPDVDLGLRRR